MAPGSTQDVDYDLLPTASDMQTTLLPEPEEMYAFRNAFMVDNEAPNRDGDSVEYPQIEEDFEGDLVEIGKDDPHPEAKLEYDGIQAAWTEYGFKFRIRDKDIRDSKINLVVTNQQRMADEEFSRLDAIAGLVLENNRNDIEIGDPDTDWNYEAAVDMETELIDAGYSTNSLLWILSPRAWGGLAKTDEFVTETERFAGEFRDTGIRHGELLGHPAVRTNTGFMDGTEAYLVDTSIYGWESPRKAFEVTDWRNEDLRCHFYALNGEIDFVPTEPDAALKGLGGTA